MFLCTWHVESGREIIPAPPYHPATPQFLLQMSSYELCLFGVAVLRMDAGLYNWTASQPLIFVCLLLLGLVFCLFVFYDKVTEYI